MFCIHPWDVLAVSGTRLCVRLRLTTYGATFVPGCEKCRWGNERRDTDLGYRIQ